ncbi:trypco2 family protein [Streptomyces sp. NPDC029004]|uniref:trypco2 family protein n=1 Tax=Streptomyces sp. NPDC029004 TaxID=3154490 RepID=UPI0034011B1C
MASERDDEQHNGLQLHQMISALRTELETAQKESAEEQLRFGVSGVELEATVQVTVGGGGKAGVRFWVIEATGGMDKNKATTQRIKLNLDVPPGTLIKGGHAR